MMVSRFLAILTLLMVNACLKSADSPEAATRGDLSISLRVSGSQTPFQSLARSASVMISGSDMADLTQALTLTDSSVEGSVPDVPAGKDRKIEIIIYDAQRLVVYYGSTVADVKANASNRISIIVKRTAGSVSVDGTIQETPDSLKLSERSLRAGAQESPQFGSFLDIDEFKTSLSANATAHPAEIDLIFAYSAATQSANIYSPDAAKYGINGSAGFDFLSAFAPANQTEVKEVSADFPGIVSTAQLDSLWSLGRSVTNGRLPVSNGTTFMARSDRGMLVLIQAGNVVSVVSGSCDFVGKAHF
jgi:hypothetical protein